MSVSHSPVSNTNTTNNTNTNPIYSEITRNVVIKLIDEKIYPDELGIKAYAVKMPPASTLCYGPGGYYITALHKCWDETIYDNDRVREVKIVVFERSGVHLVVKNVDVVKNEWGRTYIVDVKAILSAEQPDDYPVGFYRRLVKVVKRKAYEIICSDVPVTGIELSELAWIIAKLFIAIAKKRVWFTNAEAVIKGMKIVRYMPFPVIDSRHVRRVINDCWAPGPGKANFAYAELAAELEDLVIAAVPLLRALAAISPVF